MDDEVKENVNSGAVSDEVVRLRAVIEEYLSLINRQSQEISDLKNNLKSVLSERDMLLCEVSRLKFEQEMADLKRLNDSRYVGDISTDIQNDICSEARDSTLH